MDLIDSDFHVDDLQESVKSEISDLTQEEFEETESEEEVLLKDKKSEKVEKQILNGGEVILEFKSKTANVSAQDKISEMPSKNTEKPVMGTGTDYLTPYDTAQISGNIFQL